MAATTWTIGDGASQINVNIECCSLKYEPSSIHNNTTNVNSEVYNDSIMEVDLDINELQEFCNMAVRSHVKEFMSNHLSTNYKKFK
jgi:hypothetical protein